MNVIGFHGNRRTSGLKLLLNIRVLVSSVSCSYQKGAYNSDLFIILSFIDVFL